MTICSHATANYSKIFSSYLSDVIGQFLVGVCLTRRSLQVTSQSPVLLNYILINE